MSPKSSIAGARPPVVAIVGHIDHGKSTLLDYIRRANVAEGEAGGITQHLSAYEAVHSSTSSGQPTERKITFLDTPGHEAFHSMRSRGLEVADVAILIVSAEEGAKPQTLEALKLIQEVGIPYIVALTKIDKPSANLERAKNSLLENGIYLEGLGGEVPYVALSSKTGEGVPELLDLILLAADLEGLSADPSLPGEGVVIEAHVDSRRGNTATLIVGNGSIKSGEHIVAGESIAPTRIMENFLSKPVREALPGSPVRIVGFSTLPAVGTRFKVAKNKKEAEAEAKTTRLENEALRAPAPAPAATPAGEGEEAPERLVLPLVIKTDVAGTADAVVHELNKLPAHANTEVRVVYRGVGAVTEGDLQFAAGGKTPGVIVGFNVAMSRELREEAARLQIAAETFDIIYKLAEWLGTIVEERRLKVNTEERTGAAKVLKFFSATKGAVVVGGKVEEGELRTGETVKIMRRDLEVGRGTIQSLQAGKSPVKKVEAGSEFGAQIKTDIEPAPGDRLEAFDTVLK